MIEVTASVAVERPTEEVFAYLSDFRNNPRWQRGMRAARFTTTPPLRVGSTYEQEATFLGRTITSTFEVVDLEPGRSVTIASISGPFPMRITRRVEPRGDGTSQVSAVVRGDPGRLFRIARPLLQRLVRRSVRGDYRRLKRHLEAGRS